MSAAFYLSSTAALRERYEVTVYQQGWRLGGKGAAGRQRDAGDRILEHGIHVFLGWYHNAFHMIQACYAEWKKKPGNPFQSWTDAFEPQRVITLMQDAPAENGIKWIPRSFPFPQTPGVPGQGETLIDALDYLEALLNFIRHLISGSIFESELDKPSTAAGDADFHEAARASGMGASAGALSAATSVVQRLRQERPDRNSLLYRLLEKILEELQELIHTEFVEKLAHKDDLALFLWQGLDFALAAALGLLRDVIPYGVEGFDRINDRNLKDWIVANGALQENSWTAPVRAAYSLAFAFRGGRTDEAHASLAAGVGMLILLRMVLDYKDAPMWKMKGGMGDTIFTPLYEVLKARGVRFNFFHRVRNLKLSPAGKTIAAIELERQADLVRGEYEPLFLVKGLPAWPSEPLWEQLKDGEKLKREGVNFESAWCNHHVGEVVLHNGVDFDQIVLGVSLAGLPFICSELIAADERWRKMTTEIATVETLASQVWMNVPFADLGFDNPVPPMLSTYVEPFDTWGEMSDVLPYENWPPALNVRGVEYFCGAMEGPPTPPVHDPDYPRQANERVKQAALAWLKANTGLLWPKLASPQNPTGVDFKYLVDPENRSGEQRFDYQYWRANIDPSERYVLSTPGSIQYRLRSDESGFVNLYLAGDWVVSSVNGGSAEAAVEGGMAASRGICGVPAFIPNYPEPAG